MLVTTTFGAKREKTEGVKILRHLVTSNLIDPLQIDREVADQVQRDYRKHFNRQVKFWEIERSWVPSDLLYYSIKIRMNDGHFLIINHQLIFANQPWTAYIHCPYQITRGLVELLKERNDWTRSVVHSVFNCSDGSQDIVTLTQGVKDYKLSNNPAPYGLWAWCGLGW